MFFKHRDKSIMKKWAYALAHGIFFSLGLLQFWLTGRNNQRAHGAMVYFFCITGGRINEWVCSFISRRHKPLGLTSASGVLGDISGAAGAQALEQLRTKGYFVAQQALPEDVCARLMEFALKTRAVVRHMDGESRPLSARMELYDAQKPLAVRYDYPVESLLANPDVQMLMADASLLALTEEYLQTRPRLDVMSMWWHTHFHDKPDSEAAQFYHFDLDRLKWLKVFIYLTDVGPKDGPHSFIRGSHVPGGIPEHFLKKGYARLSDEEVIAHYGPDSEVTFAAPKGTIIVEDTRGLHKGNPVAGNARLILQLQFSSSLFGTNYPKNRIPAQHSAALKDRMRQIPDVYQAYF
jgi:hypothetical protein